MAALALLAGGGALGKTTLAAFSGTATNANNRIVQGTVSLSDDDSGGTLFDVTGLQLGATDQQCIVVTYGGSLAATVKMYATSSSGGLTPYLDLVIEEGSGGSFSSCTGFSATSTIYTGTLSSFASTKTSFASGVGSWAPGGAGQTKTYRITYTVNNAAPESTPATANFRWEAQNS